MYTWAQNIGMAFSAGKVLGFWVDRETAADILYLAQDGGPIDEKECLSDIGVWLSTDFTFSVQIDMAIQTGTQMAGRVLHIFRGNRTWLMLTLSHGLIQ